MSFSYFFICRNSKMDLTIIKKDWNPWEASSIFDFSYFCCPECDAKSQSKQDFVDHASNYHTWVSIKLSKLSSALVRILELWVLIVIYCSKITVVAESIEMSKDDGCQIAYFSKLRVREPVNPWLRRVLLSVIYQFSWMSFPYF